MWEFFNDTFSWDTDFISAISRDADLSSEEDSMSWSLTSGTRFNTRMRGYFVPPKTCEYSFAVKGDDRTGLYFSPITGEKNDRVRCQ